jgi:hypothetical protein
MSAITQLSAGKFQELCKSVPHAVTEVSATNVKILLIGVNRWDEKAGLRTGCCTLPSYRVLKAQEIKETGNEEG